MRYQLIQTISDYWKKLKVSLSYQLLIYIFLSLFICVLSSLIINSFLTFLHLQLGHDLSVIEDWIFHRRWEIAFASKIIGCLGSLYFIRIQIDDLAFFRKTFRFNFVRPQPIFITMIIYLGLILLIIGRPVLSGPIKLYWWQKFVSLLAPLLFLGIDGLLIYSLVGIKIISWRDVVIATPIFALATTISLYGLFLGDAEYLVPSFFCSVLFFYLLGGKHFDRIHAFYFLLLFLGPFYFILGFDPLWGGSFSVLKFNAIIGPITWAVFFAISLLYLNFHKEVTVWVVREWNEFRRSKSI